MTNCCFRCGLRRFFSASARSCYRWPGRRCSVPQPGLPAGATSIARAPWVVLSRPGRAVWPLWRRRKYGPGRRGRVFARQDGIEPFFNQLLPGSGDRRKAGVQGRCDPAVTPCFARLRGVGLQQNACLRQLLCGMFAATDQGIQPLSLFSGQLLRRSLWRPRIGSIIGMQSHRFEHSTHCQ